MRGPAEPPPRNPSVEAFFRSTRWYLLLALDILVLTASIAGYYFTRSTLAFAPALVMSGVFAFVLFRVARSGAAAAPPDNDRSDPIIR